jgi:hypothetical protein
MEYLTFGLKRQQQERRKGEDGVRREVVGLPR